MRLDGKPYGEFLVEFLDPGEAVELVLEPWKAVSGEHTIEAAVDPENVIVEEDEFNNIKFLKFNVIEEFKTSISLETSFSASTVFYAGTYMQILPKILYMIAGGVAVLLILAEAATLIITKKSMVGKMVGAPGLPPPDFKFFNSFFN